MILCRDKRKKKEDEEKKRHCMVLFIPCGTVNKGFHQSVKYYLQEYFTNIRTHLRYVKGMPRVENNRVYKKEKSLDKISICLGRVFKFN